MNEDMIYRRDVLNLFNDVSQYMGNWLIQYIEEGISSIPPAQPTLYGYNIEHLKLIARVLQKENLPPERVVEALNDINRIITIVTNEFEDLLREVTKQ